VEEEQEREGTEGEERINDGNATAGQEAMLSERRRTRRGKRKDKTEETDSSREEEGKRGMTQYA
jgi:hypothetical protein